MTTLPPAVWLDDSHALVRRGMAASLQAADLRVEGESSGFAPPPPASGLDVLVFQAEDGGLARAVAYAAHGDVALVALFRRATDSLISDMMSSRLAAALWFSDLTPASFVATVWSAAQGTSTVSPQLLGDQVHKGHRERGRLSERELNVLTLLAQGENTQAIATQMAFSERTIKNLVHDVLMKLNCRNRPHAVAQATRLGII